MIATLALSLAVLAAVPAPVPNDPAAAMDRWLTASEFRGSALVSKGGKTLLRKGYGMSDREKNVPYGPDTVFSIGSITKQFTAAAILKLEMGGKLHVEDSIAKYLPGVPEDKNAITLHMLLTHTSGLQSDFARDFDAVGRDEYVKRILASQLLSKPGTTYFYANSGYSLLGAIVEIVSGKPYEQYLHDALFVPAGMKETGYRLPKWDPARIAVGYKAGARWGKLTEKPWAPDGPYWALRANGGVHSTLDDMLRWHVALTGDTVLSKAEKDKMFARHVREGAGADTYYGYGWSIEDSPWGGSLIAHNGGNGIFFADFLRYVGEDLVVIVSTNDSEVRGGRVARALARIAHGEDVPAPEKATAKPKPLGTSGRDALARAWIDAFNATGLEAMHSFRKEHGTVPPGGDEAKYDERLQGMRKDLGRIEPEGIVGESAEGMTVRAKAATGPVVMLQFKFNAEGRVAGIGVQLGD